MSINNLTPALGDFPSLSLRASKQAALTVLRAARGKQMGDGVNSHGSFRKSPFFPPLFLDLCFNLWPEEARGIWGRQMLSLVLWLLSFRAALQEEVFPLGNTTVFMAGALCERTPGKSLSVPDVCLTSSHRFSRAALFR